MNTLHFKYVLVGGGGAGSAAAQAIREYDPQGSVILIGQEHSRPYVRPALSKEYLRRQKTRLEIVTEPVGWYVEQKIEMRTGRRAAHLDAGRRMVVLDNGEEISFNSLLLCTGAQPKPLRIPGNDLPNVFYLRTIDDCDRLHHAIDKAKSEGRPHPDGAARGRAAVVGDGLLAVEVAASLRELGLHVELAVARAHPWNRFAGENIGKSVAALLESHEIVVHTHRPADRFEGDGRVQRVVLAGLEAEPIDCDFAVVAAGIVANRELLRGTPIVAEKAILVDQQCRTNVPDIYAAGDCAAIFDPLFGKHRVLDHWDSAVATGRIAGANMAGAEEIRYDLVNSFYSEVFDLRLTAWGESRFVHHRLLRGNLSHDSRDVAEIGVAADGRVAQVLAIGRDGEHELLQELVKRRVNTNGHEETIKDPSRPLDALLG